MCRWQSTCPCPLTRLKPFHQSALRALALLACNGCSRCQGWSTDWTLGVLLHAVRCVAASYLLYIYKFNMAPSMGAIEALDMNYDARKYTVCCPWYGQRSSLFRLWQQAFRAGVADELDDDSSLDATQKV